MYNCIHCCAHSARRRRRRRRQSLRNKKKKKTNLFSLTNSAAAAAAAYTKHVHVPDVRSSTRVVRTRTSLRCSAINKTRTQHRHTVTIKYIYNAQITFQLTDYRR